MVPPSDTTQSTSPSVPKSSRSTCGEIPKVAWWGNPTHEKIISQVNKKHSSNWDEYIGKWQKQLSFLKEVKGKGGTIVTPIQTRLKGMALDQYIQQVSTRVKVIKCLKLENT